MDQAISVQFLTFEGCPLADAAKAELERALADCEISAYEEIDILAADTPEALKGWGSPTILVNGLDVTGQPKGNSASCRIYPGPQRVPDSAKIVSSIKQASRICA